MKRLLCTVVAMLVLLGTVAAYNGGTLVYVTNSGNKYHEYNCSYLKSCNEITLEEAVNRGYTPCSRCHPPTLESGGDQSPTLEGGGGQLVDIKTGKPVANGSRTRSASIEIRDLKENPIVKNAELRASNAENERDLALQQKEEAEQEAAATRAELEKLKQTFFFASLIVGFIGIPLYCFWFAAWRKQEIKRITAAVRLSMEPSQKTNYDYAPPKQSMPPPKPAPKSSPPPIRNAYDLKGNNPYLREAYRQRYEGTSIAEEAGVPRDCGVWFDAEGFPHRKSRQKTDEFTVYITDKGKSYHTASCPSAKYGRAVNICYARQRGLGPCGRCRPMAELPPWITEYQRIFRICKAFGIDVKP